MELSVASPLWAWGFAALILPILIHFFVSRWQPPRPFAAMRFLQSSAEQGKARRISDWWLLLLRLTVLSCLILALMGLQLLWPVTRSEKLTLVHPAIPASAVSAENWFWLCAPEDRSEPQWFAADQAAYALREPAQPCADSGEGFVPQLLALLQQHATLASVSAHVPEHLMAPLLAWPTSPVPLRWHAHASAESVATTSTRQWRVAAPAVLQPALQIANELSLPTLWQLTGDGEQPQLMIGSASNSAAVNWHNAILPWQYIDIGGVRYGFHVDGQQLHLQLEQPELLLQDSQRLSQMLALSDAWLSRGQLIWSQPVAQLGAASNMASVDQPLASVQQAHGQYALRNPLLLLMLLLLLLERGVVHGRR